MIVRMKKITIFAAADHADEALEALRASGVLHVQLERKTTGSISDIEQKTERAVAALDTISEPEENARLTCPPGDVVDEILMLGERKERLAASGEELDAKLSWYEKWGAVSLHSLSELATAGVSVHLHTATKAEYALLAERQGIYKIGEHGKSMLLAHLLTQGNTPLDLPEEVLPLLEQSALLDERRRVDDELAELEPRLASLGDCRLGVENYLSKLGADLEFARVKASLAQDRGICHVRGFAPVDTLEKLRAIAEKSGWAYMFEEPEEDDETPTLIRNPRWVRIIDPVMAFLGTVPGYKELDVSLWFLLFFALFVAMLIGDAGYGLIYLVLALLARRKFKQAPAEPFILIYVLSICTIVWGVLSGTYFGSERIASIPFLAALSIPAISSFDLTNGGFNDNQFFLIKLCFRIGAVHLTLAHLLAAGKCSNSPKALAQIGWIAIIWGLYCLTGMLVLGQPFPQIGGYLIGIGSLLALLFTNYQKNVLKGVGQTLIEFPLGLIGGFSDVVSYLRLFAVGYTSLVLANTFNMMAVGDGIKSPMAALGAAMILFLGHSLNLVLATMGVVVHGIRLKMLEFSGHVGNEWSGDEYKPFREKS